MRLLSDHSENTRYSVIAARCSRSFLQSTSVLFHPTGRYKPTRARVSVLECRRPVPASAHCLPVHRHSKRKLAWKSTAILLEKWTRRPSLMTSAARTLKPSFFFIVRLIQNCDFLSPNKVSDASFYLSLSSDAHRRQLTHNFGAGITAQCRFIAPTALCGRREGA